MLFFLTLLVLFTYFTSKKLKFLVSSNNFL